MHRFVKTKSVNLSIRSTEQISKTKGLLLLLLLLCLSMFKAFAQTKPLVTLSEKGTPFQTVLDKIGKQTGYTFLYGDETLKNTIPVTVALQNMPLQDALKQILTPQNLEYTIESKTIVIRTANNRPIAKGLFSTTGIVMDSAWKPLQNATVQVLGKGGAILTDANGKFSFPEIYLGSKLLITFVGYKPMQLIANKKNLGKILLEPLSSDMQEVVVSNGIYKRPLANYTGAATSFSGDELREISPTSILTALKTLDASFQMPTDVVNGSDPNVVPKVQLRGTNSITNTDMQSEIGYISNPPLVIIDGYESDIQTIFDMNINRIARITLLKDAAATAIYGSKSANGVMVVETIQPKRGEMQILYTSSVGLNIPDVTSFNLMNAGEKLKLEEIGGYYKSRDFATQQNLDDLHNLVKHNVAMGVNTYWLSQPLQLDISHNHNIMVGGGGKNTVYQGAFSYAHTGGIMKGSSRDNFSASISLKYSSRRLIVDGQFTLSTMNGQNSPYGTFTQYSALNPYWKIRDENGNITKYVDIYPVDSSVSLNGDSHVSSVVNPLYNTTIHTIDRQNNFGIGQRIMMEWEIARSLKFRSTFYYNHTTSQTDNFKPASHSDFFKTSDFSQRGSYTQSKGLRNSYQSTSTLNFGRVMGKHTLFASGGVNLTDNSSESSKIEVVGFPSERMDDLYFGLNYLSTKPSGSYTINRTVGFLGNASYAYDNRYLTDFSYRSDGSSVFGKNARFGQMWALGTGWNVHNEKFFNHISRYVNQLKLRGSYGFTGSVDFPSYASTTTYQYLTTGRYLDLVPAVIIAMGNPDLVWQRTKKLNLGADLGLFKGRVTASFNYYVETTDDLIMTNPTPPSTGFSSYYNNLGKSQNKGYEFNMTGFILRNPKKRLFWSISTSLYHNENKILEITDELKALNEKAAKAQADGNYSIPVIQFAKGKSVSTMYVVRSMGIDPSNGYEIFLDKNGKQTYIWSKDDVVAVGDMQPKFNISFRNNFQYKWLRLNFGINIQSGGVSYNYTTASKIENINFANNADKRALKDRWQTPGVPANYKGLVDLEGYTRTNTASPLTSRFVQKNNSIEITGLSIDPGGLIQQYINKYATKFISKLTKKANESNDLVTVRFTMNNAFTINSLKREIGTSYPLNRSYTLTLSLKL